MIVLLLLGLRTNQETSCIVNLSSIALVYIHASRPLLSHGSFPKSYYLSIYTVAAVVAVDWLGLLLSAAVVHISMMGCDCCWVVLLVLLLFTSQY